MKKRMLLLTAAIVMAVSASGCTKPILMTNKETDMIAEYVAGSIVENEKNYKEALVSPTLSPTPTPTPLPTLAPGASITPGGAGAGTGVSSNVQANSDFKEVVGISGVTVEYLNYNLSKEYFDGSMNLQADKEKQLLLVSFRIANTTKKALKVNLTDMKIKYQLDLGNGTMIRPMFTVLSNDLRYLEKEIKADSSITAIVIFSVGKNAEPKNMNLMISKDDKTAIVKLAE